MPNETEVLKKQLHELKNYVRLVNQNPDFDFDSIINSDYSLDGAVAALAEMLASR